MLIMATEVSFAFSPVEPRTTAYDYKTDYNYKEHQDSHGKIAQEAEAVVNAPNMTYSHTAHALPFERAQS